MFTVMFQTKNATNNKKMTNITVVQGLSTAGQERHLRSTSRDIEANLPAFLYFLFDGEDVFKALRGGEL